MKKSILTLIMVFTVLLSSNLGFADEKYPNWLKGLEDNGRNSALITVNGFKVYENRMDHEAWFYMENETIMMPLKNLSEMMGAKVSYKDNDKKMTVKKDNKTFIFEEGKASYLVDNKEVKLSEKVALKDKQLHAPFWDVINAYDMACKIEYDKTAYLKFQPKKVQVTIWDKDIKLMYYKDEDAKKLVKNLQEYYDKYENPIIKLENQVNELKVDKLLVDSKTKYEFVLEKVQSEKAISITTDDSSKYMIGHILFVKDSEITGVMPMVLYDDQKHWYIDERLNGTDREIQNMVTKENMEKSNYIVFYSGGNNVVTLILNPFYKN